MTDDAADAMGHLPLTTTSERAFAVDRILDRAVQEATQNHLNALGARIGLPALDWRWDFNSGREITITGRSPQPPTSDRARLDAAMWIEALGMRELDDPFDGVMRAYSRETYWEMRVEWIEDVEAWQFGIAARHEEDDRAEAQMAIMRGHGNMYFTAITELEQAVRQHPGISTSELARLNVGRAWRETTEYTMHHMLEIIQRAALVQEGPVDIWWPVTAGESGPPYREPTELPIVPTAAFTKRTASLQRDVDYRRLRYDIPTLGAVDQRLWKLVGGDDSGNRSAFLSSHPHTIIETSFRAPSDRSKHRDPLGWRAYVHVHTDVVLRASFPDATYGEDDVPARAALHALAMYYWTARTETHPRWRTLHGALRFLKPDLDHDLALGALDSDIKMLVTSWQILADEPRGRVNDRETREMQEIREHYEL